MEKLLHEILFPSHPKTRRQVSAHGLALFHEMYDYKSSMEI